MVAISVDSVDDNERMADALGLDFPVLSDPGATAISAYGVLHPEGGIGGRDIARPVVFLIGSDGIIRWRELTENWRIRVGPDEILGAISP